MDRLASGAAVVRRGGAWRELSADDACRARLDGPQARGRGREPLRLHAQKRSDQRVHALALVAADPPAVEEAAVPAPGATASVLRFVRLLFSTEGAILVGLVAALYLLLMR